MAMQADLLLRGRRVIDPVNGIDRVADVAVADGKIVAVGGPIAPNGAEVEDGVGALVLPGLVDFHTHVYWGGTSLAVQAEPLAAKSGVITVIDARTAGPPTSWAFAIM
jgi:dihydroorotase